jgi:hypothetical protein
MRGEGQGVSTTDTGRVFVPADALTMRAQTIIAEKTGITLKYSDISAAIYEPLRALCAELAVGDCVELPTGLTLRVEYKPARHE